MLLFNYLNNLITIFNYFNSLIFYSLVIVTVGFIGFSVYYFATNTNANTNTNDNTNANTNDNDNANDNDRNVDTSSNNVISEAGTQTEEPSSSSGTTSLENYAYPVHEAKYWELLERLGTVMQDFEIDALNLRYIVYSYTLEQLNSNNINERIITHFYRSNFFTRDIRDLLGG